jgi:EAL domain-containing protein (putative c-di-GMP-specific phosphodiesterase class I)
MSVIRDPHQDPLFERLERQLTGWEDPPARLMQALKQNELELYAQPIFSLREPHSIAMAEVLVRMREEERALLPPGMFLPVFEYCGMMHELDRWVARQTVARLARGSRVRCFTLNISSQTLSDGAYLEDIAAALARVRLPAAALAFEISEEDLIALPASAKEFAAAARKLGFSIVLDGFGRRAAALTPLRALSAHYVKVDGVIVLGLEASATARQKLEAIVQVAEAVGVELIGECVESAAALEHLKRHGVAFAQGYGLSRPAPIDQVAAG